MQPHVHVLATGGTIASTGGEDGAAPELSGEALLDEVPGLDEYATLTVEEVSQVPGFDMDPGTTIEAARRARAAVEEGVSNAGDGREQAGAETGPADGVVVTHGTDTLAETAYLLDLVLDLDHPVIVTGAQRRPDETSSDAPANLLAAVRAAAHECLRVESPGEDGPAGRGDDPAGAFVAFNDELHAARDAVKAHTSKLETFESPNRGPVATLTRDGIDFHREPGSETDRVPLLETVADPAGALADRTVEVVLSGAGVPGSQVERAVEAGADGIVVAGTGLGNVTAALGDAIGEAVGAGVPAVVASRCHAGSTGAVYGTPGGGHTLREHGALRAGDLPPWKARLKLLAALAAGDGPRQYFK